MTIKDKTSVVDAAWKVDATPSKSGWLIGHSQLLYVVTYTIEEMNRHFATDGSDEPDPEDLVKNALDAYGGGAR